MMHVVKTGWDWDSYVTSRVGVEATISKYPANMRPHERRAECHEVDRVIMAPL